MLFKFGFSFDLFYFSSIFFFLHSNPMEVSSSPSTISVIMCQCCRIKLGSNHCDCRRWLFCSEKCRSDFHTLRRTNKACDPFIYSFEGVSGAGSSTTVFPYVFSLGVVNAEFVRQTFARLAASVIVRARRAGHTFMPMFNVSVDIEKDIISIALVPPPTQTMAYNLPVRPMPLNVANAVTSFNCQYIAACNVLIGASSTTTWLGHWFQGDWLNLLASPVSPGCDWVDLLCSSSDDFLASKEAVVFSLSACLTETFASLNAAAKISFKGPEIPVTLPGSPSVSPTPLRPSKGIGCDLLESKFPEFSDLNNSLIHDDMLGDHGRVLSAIYDMTHEDFSGSP